MTAITPEIVREHVLRYVAESLAPREMSTLDLPEEFDLLGEGVLDSFGVLELISSIESRFKIEVDFEQLDAGDITVIGPLCRYVAAHATNEMADEKETAAAAPSEKSVSEPEPLPLPAAAFARPHPVRHVIGRASVGSYRFLVRAMGKSFSLLSGGSFASFGSRSVLQPPVRLLGEHRIAIGKGVYIGANSWLQVLDGHGNDVAIIVADSVSIAGHCVLSAVRSIRIGRSASLARNVYIADHAHAYRDPSLAIANQGITDVQPVEICDGAWLGENVVVLPGVRIGVGAVIAANSVVTSNVPDHALAAGTPARVVSRFG